MWITLGGASHVWKSLVDLWVPSADGGCFEGFLASHVRTVDVRTSTENERAGADATLPSAKALEAHFLVRVSTAARILSANIPGLSCSQPRTTFHSCSASSTSVSTSRLVFARILAVHHPVLVFGD